VTSKHVRALHAKVPEIPSPLHWRYGSTSWIPPDSRGVRQIWSAVRQCSPGSVVHPQHFQAFESLTTLAFTCVRATETADGGSTVINSKSCQEPTHTTVPFPAVTDAPPASHGKLPLLRRSTFHDAVLAGLQGHPHQPRPLCADRRHAVHLRARHAKHNTHTRDV
jgi:hypothetical protein